ncbi:hypothetical protein [Streptomyces sp. ODS28]|uniref:hypothetical protein n=1 Tax=Streptomyces sp. ODS28 TaxID=3136688 RepID=UPI0031E65380
MSAISLILLVAAVCAVALGAAALHTVRGLRGELTALRAELAGGSTVPAARSAASAAYASTAYAADAEHAPVMEHARHAAGREEGGAVAVSTGRTDAEEIRAAVADALAEERERELAEARAFWAEQEARDAEQEAGPMLAGESTAYEYDAEAEGPVDPVGPAGLEAALLDALLEGRLEDSTLDSLGRLPGEGSAFIPRQPGRDDVEPGFPEPGFDQGPEVVEPADRPDSGGRPDAGHEPAEESPELAAARRRHPSQPDYTLNGDPVVPAPAGPATARTTDGERTLGRLTELAEEGTPLADVRPGPLGTLDVYVFEDGTTVCLSPGHRETAEALTEALRRGENPVLMGGSALSGGYALTFAYGTGETAYLLADRVIASL